MFDLDQFIADCQAAHAADASAGHVREVVRRAVSRPEAVLATLGAPRRAGMRALHHSPSLTIVSIVWAPMMTVTPHDHLMWAVIGIYAGREDNILWRRQPGSRGRLEAAGAIALGVRDAGALDPDAIHSVTNPIPRLTAAIHVYGGDFFGVPGRREWDPETLLERPFDHDRAVAQFDSANAVTDLAQRAGIW